MSTIISFKNQVDDFYLNHLRTDHMLIEVYIIKGSKVIAGESMSATKHTEKIGEARLPLSPLLEKEVGF